MTAIIEFSLLGFQGEKNFRLFLFCLLLVIYCGTICGNLLIIILVSISKNLHTPMYFLIAQLAISDALLTTNIAPNMFHVLLNDGATITFAGCITQFYFFDATEAFECLLLTVMSYDRYVAICNPLRYTSIMTSAYCIRLAMVSWLLGFSITLLDTITISMLIFCGPTIIDHFFCDFLPLLELTCSDTLIVQLEVFVLSVPSIFIPTMIFIYSYANIALAILRIPSSTGRQKAFSTCSSHLTVVSIFYWAIFSVYVVPTKYQTLPISKILSLLYTVFTPMINPIIYSFRNKDIKKAARCICQTCESPGRPVKRENNLTAVTEFFFLGLQGGPSFRLLLFCLLLVIYCGTICGNLLIITLVSTSKNLHTPMYFFISQLSVGDILLTTNIAPNMFHILMNDGSTITFSGCITQLYFFASSEASECLLLTVMSYDRYVAICNPLRYTSIMTSAYCMTLTMISWLLSFTITLLDTITISTLIFCRSNIVDHFYCDPLPLLKIACSDPFIVQIEMLILSIPSIFIPTTIIIYSYANIALAILRIPSSTGRQKAFSTCSSHLIVVFIFYGTIFSVYVVPSRGYMSNISKILSLLYTVFTPMINPIIYSFRNKDMKKAVHTMLHKGGWGGRSLHQENNLTAVTVFPLRISRWPKCYNFSILSSPGGLLWNNMWEPPDHHPGVHQQEPPHSHVLLHLTTGRQ
ncbi:Olfactory receptor [Pristimantis euphronides]